MSVRQTAEFKVALNCAKAAYSYDQKVERGEAPGIAGILVLQQPGLIRMPLVAVFAEFYKYQSPEEIRGLGRFVQRFMPEGDYQDSARTLRNIYGDRAKSWVNILLDERIPTLPTEFLPQVQVFPKPGPKDPLGSLESDLKTTIDTAEIVKPIGNVHPVIYMTGYRRSLVEHYAAPASGQNKWLMDTVTVDDFDRWASVQKERVRSKRVATWEALRSKFGEKSDGSFGVTDYRLAKFDIYRLLENSKPDQVEDLVRNLAMGITYEGFNYSPALKLAINKWDQLEPRDKRAIFQWTECYRPISPSDLVDRMAAPSDIRDYLMWERIGLYGENNPRNGLYIAYAELARQKFLHDLRHVAY